MYQYNEIPNVTQSANNQNSISNITSPATMKTNSNPTTRLKKEGVSKGKK
ncbi:23166_t:CDS:1, partial [Dentiscutata erythropus]